MKKMLILLIIVMLSSCRSVERNDEMETMEKDDGLSISFIVDEKYYAELKKDQGMYFLSIPELIIRDLRLNRYTTKLGNPVFSAPGMDINIKLYEALLFFSYGSYHAYIPYHETGKKSGDYYHFI